MTTVDDTAVAIADEYAEAALALAEEQGVAETFLSELGSFVAHMRLDKVFGDFMESPVIDAEKRRDVLERTLRGKMSDLLLDTILVLNGKGRSGLIPLFHDRFRVVLERLRNEVEVLVTTAHPLTGKLRERLTRALADRTGRKPRLVENVDPSAIAGLKIQIGDELLDDSAASHLTRMRATLAERASRELHAGEPPIAEE